MSDPEDINPYAAPQSQTLLTPSANDPSRRPTSVKAVSLLMFAVMVFMVYDHAQYFLRYGVQMWSDYPLETIFDLLKLTAILALFLGGQRAWIFWTTLVTLVVVLYSFVEVLLPDLHQFNSIEKLEDCLSIFLFLYLFYRFAFGQPCRRYFGLPLQWSVR